MASVVATSTSTHSSRTGQFLPCPTSYPTWKSPHRNYVDTSSNPSGHTTTWTTHHDIIRLSVTDSHNPKAICIAHFPSFDTSNHFSAIYGRPASLVTASYRFITIATPGEDIIRSPIGDPLMDPMSPTELFTPPCGLILKTSHSAPPHYHYLAHPLQQPIPLHDLPSDHSILYAFQDIPLLITLASSIEKDATLTVWSCSPTDTPIPTFPPTPSNFYRNGSTPASPATPANTSTTWPLSTPLPPELTPLTPTPSEYNENLLSVSTLKLSSIYQIPVHPTNPITAFLSHDVHGLLTLCIVSDSVLTGLSIIQTDETTYKLSPSFRIRDVISAVPVLAVRRPHDCLDTLVQHSNGSLSLFMGRNRLCSITLPSTPSSPSILNSSKFKLSQPVAYEFSLFHSNSGEGMRFSLENACFVSLLVNDCLAAITFSFEEASAVTRITALYHDLLTARTAIKSNSAALSALSSSSSSYASKLYSAQLSSPGVKNIEWSLLETVLLRIISPNPPTHVSDDDDKAISTDIDATQLGEDDNLLGGFDDIDDIDDENFDGSDSDWHALLQSDYHEEYTMTKEFCAVPPRPPRSPSISSSPSSFLDSSFPSSIGSDSSIPNMDILKQVLHALHLLYEDRKLRTICTDVCRQLARLNYRLACVLGNFSYIDHYRRDFPDLVLNLQSQHPLNINMHIGLINSGDRNSTIYSSGSAVPSIMDYLTAKICGHDDLEPKIKISRYPVRKDNGRLECNQDTSLTASWRTESPFQLTQRIINYYNILFSAEEPIGDRDIYNISVGGEEISGRTAERVESIDIDRSRHKRVLLAMVADNVTKSDIDALPFGIALPLRDVLWKCRQEPNSNWPYAAFALIGREDLFNYADIDIESQNSSKSSTKPLTKLSTEYNSMQLVRESRALLQIYAAAASTSIDDDHVIRTGGNETNGSHLDEHESNKNGGRNGVSEDSKSSFVEEKGDGCELEASTFKLRFSQDRRLNEVRRLLRSTDLVVMNAVQQQQNDGHSPVEFDMIAEQKLKLATLLRKRFAAPVGRGAYTLRTFMPTDPTKPLPVPKICMTGTIFGQNAKVTYIPPDASLLQWGEFHNGVAAGLRIIAADSSGSGGNNRNRNGFDNDSSNGIGGSNTSGHGHGAAEQILTRSWIVNHKPSDTSGGATHAGMLLALGLGGYLPVLRKTDYIQYLVPRHELTAIGLMLGLSAGNVGCADDKITKMLCLHIRPFNEAGFSVPEFQVSVNVQTSAILGLGLLHLGSCEHSLLEGLFSELGRRPKPGDAIDNREGLALAAGFSIGLICLGHGTSAFDAASSRRRIDTLILYANGGSTHELSLPSNASATGGSTSGREWLWFDEMMNGSMNGTNHMMMMDSNTMGNGSRVAVIPGQDHRTNAAIAAAAAAVAESETSRVMEGIYVNNDVTSPGALMALALIFMKTNDKRLVKRISLPDSLYSLARIRSDHVYLRLLTRCLIMWDDIQAKEEWIRSVIPLLLLPINEMNNSFDLKGKINVSEHVFQQDVDVSGILQARAFALAAVCTAIALKYAGTNDAKAKSLLIKGCESFENALISTGCVSETSTMEFVYGTGLCCTALSLSIISAGSGDLTVLRLFRRLRKRGGYSSTANTGSIHQQQQQQKHHERTTLGVGRYGLHMAIHMAIGFLFLGGGCQTFGTSNLGIVGLLCSIYTPFPRDISDNQYHLQAFRHLYVLAVEPRCMETRDVDTGKWCSVDLQISTKQGNVLKVQTPCIVPEVDRIKDIYVIGERYLQTKVKINHAVKGSGWYSNCRSQVVFVKRKTGHLPYNIDPKGGKGILSRALNRPKPEIEGERNDNDNNSKYFTQVEHLVKAFSADPEIVAFVKYFCSVDDDKNEEEEESDDSDTNEVIKINSKQENGEKEKQYVEMLYDCLSNDKADGVKVYVDLQQAVETLQLEKNNNNYIIPTATIDGLKLCEAYMLKHERNNNDSGLVRKEFVSGILRQVRNNIHKNEDVCHALIRYVSSCGSSWPCTKLQNVEDEMKIKKINRLLAYGLRLNSIPVVSQLRHVAEWTSSSTSTSTRNDSDDLVWKSLLSSDGKLNFVNDSALEFLLDAVTAQNASKSKN